MKECQPRPMMKTYAKSAAGVNQGLYGAFSGLESRSALCPVFLVFSSQYIKSIHLLLIYVIKELIRKDCIFFMAIQRVIFSFTKTFIYFFRTEFHVILDMYMLCCLLFESCVYYMACVLFIIIQPICDF